MSQFTGFQQAVQSAFDLLNRAADMVEAECPTNVATPTMIADLRERAARMQKLLTDDRWGPDDAPRLWLESSALTLKYRRLRNLGYQAAGFCQAHENGLNLGFNLQEAVSDFEKVLAGKDPAADKPEGGQ